MFRLQKIIDMQREILVMNGADPGVLSQTARDVNRSRLEKHACLTQEIDSFPEAGGAGEKSTSRGGSRALGLPSAPAVEKA